MEDAKVACDCGVDGVDLVIGTSKQLREHSHGKDMDYIKKTALEVIAYVKRYVWGDTREGFLRDAEELTNRAAGVSRFVSAARTALGPISSTCSISTGPSTGPVSTAWVLPTRWAARRPAKYTTSCALFGVSLPATAGSVAGQHTDL